MIKSLKAQIRILLSCKSASSEPISCISAATWWLGTEIEPSGATQGASWSNGSLGLRILPSRTKLEKLVPKKVEIDGKSLLNETENQFQFLTAIIEFEF